MIASSDSGMLDNDNVTGIIAPAFRGNGEVNAQVRIFANDGASGPMLVGQGVVGTDETDGVANGLGEWEITVEPLDDGTWSITAEAEDLAGNISAMSSPLASSM